MKLDMRKVILNCVLVTALILAFPVFSYSDEVADELDGIESTNNSNNAEVLVWCDKCEKETARDELGECKDPLHSKTIEPPTDNPPGNGTDNQGEPTGNGSDNQDDLTGNGSDNQGEPTGNGSDNQGEPTGNGSDNQGEPTGNGSANPDDQTGNGLPDPDDTTNGNPTGEGSLPGEEPMIMESIVIPDEEGVDDTIVNPAPENTLTDSPLINPETTEATVEEPTNVFPYTPNPDYTPAHFTQDLNTEMFISSIAEQARQIGQEYGIYASVMIAQAILESGSGNSALSRSPNNNLFGIKGNHNGASVVMKTSEDDGLGNYYTIDGAFRRYKTKKDSLEDYAELLTKQMSGFYSGALKGNAKTYEEAAIFLQGRYATSTSYASNLIGLIETYELDRYDKPLRYTLTGARYDQGLQGENGEVFSGQRDLTMDDYAALEAISTSFLGLDYVWGGTSPLGGFDCSGFVQYCYREALGISLPRTTYYQQHVGQEVPFSELQMGDILLFDADGDVNHVGMYLGNGYYIHCTRPGGVQITAMEAMTPAFAKRIANFVEA